MPYYNLTVATAALVQGRPWSIRLASATSRQFWEASSAKADLAFIRYGSLGTEGKTLEKVFDFQKIQREVKLKLNKGYTYVDWTRQELSSDDGPAPLEGPFALVKFLRIEQGLYGTRNYVALNGEHEVLFELAQEGAEELQTVYGIAIEDSQSLSDLRAKKITEALDDEF